jgi:hypothetical protein
MSAFEIYGWVLVLALTLAGIAVFVRSRSVGSATILTGVVLYWVGVILAVVLPHGREQTFGTDGGVVSSKFTVNPIADYVVWAAVFAFVVGVAIYAIGIVRSR